MSWLSSLFHPERGYQNAQDQLQQFFNQAQGQMHPYNQAGQNQLSNLMEYINSLKDPSALTDQWMQDYEQSDLSKNTQQVASDMGMDAASSMGLLGSSPALNAIQAGTTQIGLQDRQNYLNDLMQKYMQGAGLSQGVYNTGAGMAGQMGQNSMNMGGNMAQMQFGRDNAQGNLWSNIFKGAATAVTPLGMGWASNALGLNNNQMPWTVTGGY